LPSYHRQRLSSIRRGWCPSRSQKGFERVIRSDAGVAHRLSLSARVVSTGDSQVKAKRQGWKRLWRLQNRPPPVTRKARQRQLAEGYATGSDPILPGYYRVARPPPASSTRRTPPPIPRGCAFVSAQSRNFALNPRHHPRRCRRRAYRPPHAACGSDRPTAFDRPRWRRAAFDASRARSPCRPISR
jgi:hypothetical protein